MYEFWILIVFCILWFVVLGNVYSLFRLFMRFALNVFFRDIKIRGSYKIPEKGPVIFAVAPHANQFIDPLMLIVSCNRDVGFLMAKKSMDKFWIGMFGRAFHSIPVERPQDLAFSGKGTIYVDKQDPHIIHGHGTVFSQQLQPRSVLTLPKGAGTAEVVQVISDFTCRIKRAFEGDQAETALIHVDEKGQQVGSSYKITPYVNQSNMFNEVTRRLHLGAAVGIFPEGGSHDRPEMLPLKPGVAMMALQAMETNPDMDLTIIPVGLNYFNADRFRSRAVIEYGDPIKVPRELVIKYANGGSDKRDAVGILLSTTEVALKQLTLQAPDFETLMIIQAARRLYAAERKLDIDGDLRVSRRFAHAFTAMRDRPEVQSLIEEVRYYNRMLNLYGVRDHQVKNTSVSPGRAVGLLIYRTIQLVMIVLLASPMLVLGAPLLYLAKRVSKQKMVEAKEGSSVKIAGKDVVSTWKLLTSLFVIPILWITYTLLTLVISRLLGYSTFMSYVHMFAFFVLYPVLGYATILVGDIGIDIAKSLPPLMVSLGNVVSSSEPLRELRRKLKDNIEKLVKDLGPEVFPELELKRRPSANAVLSMMHRGVDASTQYDEVDEWQAMADQLTPE
ncbi:hypothetical protein EDD86DRAFT_189537 [Gorgonomyces haynaldii]|nr:hypothetical protein EDD86DRAFT_189537 [Gorgonomyces haynaldii]